MPTVFWTGRLSPLMKALVNFNCALAWLSGKMANIPAMKHRMKLGYSGICSNDVTFYDKKGSEHYHYAAEMLLKGIDVKNRVVLDAGCGTGIVSLMALKQGASSVLGIDISRTMVNLCREKSIVEGLDKNQATFKQADIENLNLPDNSFDAALSGLVLGLVPNQVKALKQMYRVLKPGGRIAIAMHGPEIYWEACDATFRATSKRLVLGYRIEFWPRKEKEIRKMLVKAGFRDVTIRKLSWHDEFDSGDKTYDFFTSVSSAWWLAKFPPDKRIPESEKARRYFKDNKINRLTFDVILAYGQKSQ